MTTDIEEIAQQLVNLIAKHQRERKEHLMSTYPIVGAFYRPPAQALISVLSIGTPLTLIAEPENEHDINAVAVWLYSKDIGENAHEVLEGLLPSYGTSLETVLSQEAWHIGYIAKEYAKQLREAGTVPTDGPKAGSFSLSTGGAPRVRLTDG